MRFRSFPCFAPSFANVSQDIWTQDVLNLGVLPRRLLDSLRRRFADAGGVIFENTAFRNAAVHPVRIRPHVTCHDTCRPACATEYELSLKQALTKALHGRWKLRLGLSSCVALSLARRTGCG
jgi:hypothetical protein